MSLADRRPHARSPEIWDRFLQASADKRIPQNQWRWYAYRVELYLKTVPGVPLERQSSEDVVRYLEVLDRNGG